MMKNRPEIAGDHHLETLGNCGGYYSCPKGPSGNRLGPLVGYAGKYKTQDGKELQFVGDVYANFAKAEIYPYVLKFFARNLAERLLSRGVLDNADVFCGAPIGGYSLADKLGDIIEGVTVIKAEKKITALATSCSGEVSTVSFARHDVEPGQRVVIVEDACNNFSTTDKMIANIILRGGKVAAIACFINRSLTVDDFYSPKVLLKNDYTSIDEMAGMKLPVVSLVRQPIPEWNQDDPAVAEDIARGNVVLKPKNEWSRPMKAMHAQSGAP